MGARRQAIRAAALAAVSVAALASAAAPGYGEALPAVKLTQNGPVAAGEAVTVTASTRAQLGTGQYGLELRGIDLKKAKRATYARPDYAGKRCIAQPCRWKVTANRPTTYELRAFLVRTRSGRAVTQSPPERAVWVPRMPQGLQLLLNGKVFKTEPLEGGKEDYIDIPAGKLNVEARWTNEAHGYYVVISTTEPKVKDYVKCVTGTSCRVPQAVPILDDQEMAWTVRLWRSSDNLPISGFKVCLVGRA